MRTNDQKILITGGGSGIGFALARRLVSDNHVAVIGRSQERLRRASEAQPSLLTLPVDIGSAAGARSAVEWASAEMSGISLLINSAGIMRPYALDDPHAPEWADEDVRSNLVGAVLMAGYALPHLRSASEAALVFISSAVAYAAAPGWGVYAATKAGVHALARSLRAELEPQGIKVFDVAPPIVDTGPAAGLAVPKLPVERVVEDVLAGLRDDRREIRIGRARALALLARFSPRRADAALARALGGSARS
jgi:uncharacterized oxidoreductase